MARKPDIQYVHQFYVYGSEAPALELKSTKRKRKTTLPKAVPEQKIEVRVDPVALCGMVVAVTMLILMAVGVHQYLAVCKSYEVMTDYVIDLQNENVELKQTYEAGYDLDDIAAKATALGMIPADQAQVITFDGTLPEPEPETPFWEEIIWFFQGLFA